MNINVKKNENETTREYVNRFNAEYNKALEEKAAKKNKKKSKRKGLIFGIGLGILAALAAVGLIKNNNKKGYEAPKDAIETVVDDDMSLDDLGFEEEVTPEDVNDVIYGETTGNVKKEDVVEKDGTIWKDKEAADKSNQVGKTTIDDKNGTLEVKPNGDVYEKDKGYEVKDENGNIKDTGTNSTGTPDDYVWDNEENKGLKDGYVYADKDYYNEFGELIIKKGQVVKKTTLDALKEIQPTTNNNKNNNNANNNNTNNNNTNNNNNNTTTETTVTETFTPAEGVVNPDGTYTIDGITFESKADYEQWIIQGYEGYAIDSADGIMKSIDEKTLVKTK